MLLHQNIASKTQLILRLCIL
jgi:colicin import membrane protein